jgi:hypothetical protein
VWVTIDGFWFGRLDLLTPYTITTRDYRQLQRYRYSSTYFPVHRYRRTRVLSLYQSYTGNGFITVSLSLSSDTKSSLHSLVPFLPLFCNSIPSSSPGRLVSRTRLCSWVDCSLLFYAVEHFFIITLHGPHGKHNLLFSAIAFGVLTAPLHSNGGDSNHIENTASIIKEACWLVRCLSEDVLVLCACACVRMCLPSRNLAKGLYITILPQATLFSNSCSYFTRGIQDVTSEDVLH